MHLARLHFQRAVTANSLRRNDSPPRFKAGAGDSGQCLLEDKRAAPSCGLTHRSPAAGVGIPAGPGTAAEEGSPAAEPGLAGTPPAVGRTGRYLQGVTAGNVSEALTNTATQADTDLVIFF